MLPIIGDCRRWSVINNSNADLTKQCYPATCEEACGSCACPVIRYVANHCRLPLRLEGREMLLNRSRMHAAQPLGFLSFGTALGRANASASVKAESCAGSIPASVVTSLGVSPMVFLITSYKSFRGKVLGFFTTKRQTSMPAMLVPTTSYPPASIGCVEMVTTLTGRLTSPM